MRIVREAKNKILPKTIDRSKVKAMLSTLIDGHVRAAVMLHNNHSSYANSCYLLKRLISLGIVEVYNPVTLVAEPRDMLDRLSGRDFIRKTERGELLLIELNEPAYEFMPVRERGVRMKYGADAVSPDTKATKAKVDAIKSAVTRPMHIFELIPVLGLSKLSVLRYVTFMLHYQMLDVVVDGEPIEFNESTKILGETMIQLRGHSLENSSVN